MSLSHTFTIIDALLTVLDEEHAHAVVDHRRSKKCPLTKRAAELLAAQFALCKDPNEAADEMIIRGWRGFKAEWVPELCNPISRSSASPAFRQLWETYPIRDAEDFSGAVAAFEAVPTEDHALMLQAAGWLKSGLPARYDPTYRERSMFIPALKAWISERRYEAKRSMWEQSEKRKQGEKS